jgi:hypothetical protein
MRHPPSSWQNRYVRYRKKFDEKLNKYLSDPSKVAEIMAIFPGTDQIILQAEKRVAMQWMSRKDSLMHPTTLTHATDESADYLGEIDPNAMGKQPIFPSVLNG